MTNILMKYYPLPYNVFNNVQKINNIQLMIHLYSIVQRVVVIKIHIIQYMMMESNNIVSHNIQMVIVNKMDNVFKVQ